MAIEQIAGYWNWERATRPARTSLGIYDLVHNDGKFTNADPDELIVDTMESFGATEAQAAAAVQSDEALWDLLVKDPRKRVLSGLAIELAGLAGSETSDLELALQVDTEFAKTEPSLGSIAGLMGELCTVALLNLTLTEEASRGQLATQA